MALHQASIVFFCISTMNFLYGLENKEIASVQSPVSLHLLESKNELNTENGKFCEPGVVYTVIEMTETEKRLAWIELAKILQDFL